MERSKRLIKSRADTIIIAVERSFCFFLTFFFKLTDLLVNDCFGFLHYLYAHVAGRENRYDQGCVVPRYDTTDILGHIICARAPCSIEKSLCVAMKHNGNDVKIPFFFNGGKRAF